MPMKRTGNMYMIAWSDSLHLKLFIVYLIVLGIIICIALYMYIQPNIAYGNTLVAKYSGIIIVIIYLYIYIYIYIYISIRYPHPPPQRLF